MASVNDTISDPDAVKRLVQCMLLDDAGVPNGDKAIAIFMAKHWDDELVETFGPPNAARTIRAWRASRGRLGRRTVADMRSLPRRFLRKPAATSERTSRKRSSEA